MRARNIKACVYNQESAIRVRKQQLKGVDLLDAASCIIKSSEKKPPYF